jgi:lipoprotein NlpI
MPVDARRSIHPERLKSPPHWRPSAGAELSAISLLRGARARYPDKMTRRVLTLLCVVACAAWPQTPREDPQEIFNRAVGDFQAGRIAQSVAGFDRVAKLVPDYAPQLWQRGIALYYAGRYKDCRAQFESHRTVNPDDVENAAWHFLCVARAESPAKAKAALLPVGPDLRKPMREIYQMFRGELMPDQVLAAAGDGKDLGAEFYARLYVALYYEAAGDATRARQHIAAAAEDRFQEMGYMYGVARVHLNLASRSPATKANPGK